MNEKFEYQGYWWLPAEPDRRVPGTLKFDPDDGVGLEVFGSLESPKEGATNFLEPELILGLSLNGRLITLHLRSPGVIPGLPGLVTYSYYAVDTIFVGEHFERSEDLGFERLSVEYLHLAWARESGFDIRFNQELEEPKRRWREVRHDLRKMQTRNRCERIGQIVELREGGNF